MKGKVEFPNLGPFEETLTPRGLRADIYHWGQNDYLLKFYSRRIILGNSMCSLCMQEKF